MKEKNESKKKPIAILLLLIQRLLLMTVAMHPLQHLLYCFGLNPCDHCQTSMAALTPGDSHTTSYTDQQPRLLVGGNPADKKQQHVNKREGVRMHGKGKKKKKTKLSVCPRLICPAETTLISHLLRGYQVANNPSAGCWEDKALAQQMHRRCIQVLCKKLYRKMHSFINAFSSSRREHHRGLGSAHFKDQVLS